MKTETNIHSSTPLSAAAKDILEKQLPAGVRQALYGPAETLSAERISTLVPHPVREKFVFAKIDCGNGLESDIVQHGLQTPITIIQNYIVDGVRRLTACQKTGTPPVFRILPAEAGGYVESIIISANFKREHWEKSQRAMIAARMSLAFGGQAGLGRSAQRAGAIVGVSGTLVKRAKKLLGTKYEGVVISGKRTVDQALRDSRVEVARMRAIQEALANPPQTNSTIYCGDFRKTLAMVPDESVDLILTDPPYHKKFLPLWKALADLAARILKPGGKLVAISGTEFLPDVFAQFAGGRLRWGWKWEVVFNGPIASHPARGFENRSRPVLIYFKPDPKIGLRRPLGPGDQDVVFTTGVDQSFHPYGQKVELYEYLAKRFSKPDALVVDPFGGGGTVAKACVNTGRHCITSEINPKCFRTIHRRIFGCSPTAEQK